MIVFIYMKKIAQFTGDKLNLINIFPSIVSAEKRTGIVGIKDYLYKNQKKAGGFHWEYYNKEKSKYRLQQSKKRSVVQLNKQGDVLNQYESICEASQSTGIEKANISRCVRGGRPTAGGFIWR